MTDYISRETAVKIVEKYGLAEGSTLGHHSGIADCIASEISRVPESDVTPVRHGHWMLTECGDAMCSRCRESYVICDEPEHARAMMRYFAQEWRWCPGCGAKMDEEAQQ